MPGVGIPTRRHFSNPKVKECTDMAHYDSERGCVCLLLETGRLSWDRSMDYVDHGSGRQEQDATEEIHHGKIANENIMFRLFLPRESYIDG